MRISSVEINKSSETISTSRFLTKANPPVASSAEVSFALDGKVKLIQANIGNRQTNKRRLIERLVIGVAPSRNELVPRKVVEIQHLAHCLADFVVTTMNRWIMPFRQRPSR
jgi:hypothetical protein